MGFIWAVHIADGVLGWPALAAGFAIAGVLAFAAAWRVREEEIPRIALLTAAFFVASSIHVKLGPTSVHLLLNGLVGVVLGWRAPLAVLIGVALQALLIPHGGLTTVGVNAAAEMVPALLAAALFPWLVSLSRGTGSRSLLVGAGAAMWGGQLVGGAALLAYNPWRNLVRFTPSAGLVVSVENFRPALDWVAAPVTLVGLALLAVAAAWFDRRGNNPPEFAAGACVGALSVVFTTLLTGLFLVADGAERWNTFATAVFLVHLPLALLEGLLLGVVAAFLARVKPEMLRLPERLLSGAEKESIAAPATVALLALLALLASASPARAHNLEVASKVDREKKRVTIESWYETGDPPKEAKARVLRPDGSVLTDGPLDAKGNFTFSYETPEDLLVEITAPGGHKARLRLRAGDLGDTPPPATAAPERSRGHDLLLGLTFLLALSAFVLSWRNAVRLRTLSNPP